MNLPGGPLTDADLAKHEQGGISRDLAIAAMLRRVNSAEGGQEIGRNGHGDYEGIIYPYIWPGEDYVREKRLRLDRPPLERSADGSRKSAANI